MDNYEVQNYTFFASPRRHCSHTRFETEHRSEQVTRDDETLKWTRFRKFDRIVRLSESCLGLSRRVRILKAALKRAQRLRVSLARNFQMDR